MQFNENLKKSEKLDYIWNSIAGIMAALQNIIVAMIVTRKYGVEEAGVISIAFAIGNLLIIIGKFGMRNFQISDVKHSYSTLIYTRTRLLTALMMVASIIMYDLYEIIAGYSISKVIIITLICIMYLYEAIEDVFWASYQQNGYMYIGARLFAVRWIIFYVAFFIAVFVNSGLIEALALATVISVLSSFFLLVCFKKYLPNYKSDNEKNNVNKLLKDLIPLFLIGFISFYILNAPKYAIDFIKDDVLQARYGFIAMPMFAVHLLSSFVYQPKLVDLSENWRGKNIKVFKKQILTQLLFIAIISVICLMVSYFCGIEILEFIFADDLSNYKSIFLMLMGVGIIWAIIDYFYAVLIIIKCERVMFVLFIIAFILIFAVNGLLRLYGLTITVIYYLAVLTLLLLGMSIYCINKIRLEK